MSKRKIAKLIVSYSEGFLTFVNVMILLRMLTLSIDIERYRDELTGRLSYTGDNILFMQEVVEGFTNTFIYPFRTFLKIFIDNSYIGLIDILSPIFSVIVLLFIMLIIKLAANYIFTHYNLD